MATIELLIFIPQPVKGTVVHPVLKPKDLSHPCPLSPLIFLSQSSFTIHLDSGPFLLLLPSGRPPSSLAWAINMASSLTFPLPVLTYNLAGRVVF
jgi:hypothetical protein